MQHRGDESSPSGDIGMVSSQQGMGGMGLREGVPFVGKIVRSG